MPRSRRLTTFSAAALIVLNACATVAVTGRTQLNLVSDSELVAGANEQFARFMGAASAKNAVLQAGDAEGSTSRPRYGEPCQQSHH